MEASSPLAALHRPMLPTWGSRDVFRGHPHYATSSVTSASMSLREQMHKHSNGDYFNVKDVRGSSPAASLAADLSQNFRLDSDSRFVVVFGTCFQSALINMFPVLNSLLLEEPSSLLA
jgi:M-phase inducer tyrosine phosphatase